jgi:hypothetical protein
MIFFEINVILFDKFSKKHEESRFFTFFYEKNDGGGRFITGKNVTLHCFSKW